MLAFKKLTFLCSLFMVYMHSSWAAIIVSSGGLQKIPVGTPSANLEFKVIDEMGNSETGKTVKFNLVDPSGKLVTNALSTYLSETNVSGHVVTSLMARNIIGNYTITATLVQHPEQFVSTSVTVLPGPPTTLSVLKGDLQTLSMEDSSESIIFRLTDVFGNPLVDHRVNFSVQLPTGEITHEGLTPQQLVTDSKGQVSTSFKAPRKEGEYVILATLESNEKITHGVTLQVMSPLPQLPNLGFGNMLNVSGKFVKVNVSFYGGISVNEKEFEQETVLSLDDKVFIQGLIQVDETHLGKQADILVMVSYQPFLNSFEQYYMLNEQGTYPRWDGNIMHLEAFLHQVVLPKKLVVTMYEGKFLAQGQVKIYFGYRLDDGSIIFNGNQTINALINQNSK